MENRLRSLRERRGLTLERLGEMAGTSAQQIQRLEVGERKLTVQWAAKLAPLLNVPWYLLYAPEGCPAPMPEDAQLVEDRSEISLLQFWRGLDPDQKNVITATLRAMRARPERETA